MGWLKEPLFHFLLIGAGLFVLFYEVSEPFAELDDRIIVDEQQVRQLTSLWAQRWQRPPTARELEGLIESQIREEVLYREAKALGLDQDDTIVRRRMTQKMEFLFGDLAEQAEPSEAELAAFLAAHPERFTSAARYSLVQVYLNPERRGEAVLDRARELLETLRARGADVDPLEFGDPFLMDLTFENAGSREIARTLGEQFVAALATAPVGAWHGPVESAYGVHLVYVSDRQEAQLAPLEAVRDRVRTELEAQRREEADEAAYRQLRARYDIVVEQPSNLELANDREAR